ncbi:hypothetical protein EHS25_003069 [Saitozyma podzolica]|uniref:Vacuolar protein sorting-associated protein 52 n=1 Tax=Saitozyma podzolica TaxID=1890683 RepID=A0A427YCF1_9TREE|nr:hypothetical protein EHS25_003069 [Saitozyma podzolica]
MSLTSDPPNGHTAEEPLETPGAGPSRLSIQGEEEDRELFLRRRKDYLDLDSSVQSSNELLSSLASYLSTFQNDLSAVSGQVADLQQRSADIESQLKGRKTILPPLNALLADITLPPALVLTLRDTQPSQNPELWLSAIAQLDEKIHAVRSRGKVRAAKEMESVIDGLRLKALTQLPPFLLSLIRPLRSPSTGLSTNLAVLQTSLLLKYQSFYAFLFRQSPRLAKQVERGYVNAARSYYETGMRRYARALGAIKARTTEKLDLIGVVSSDPAVMAKTQEGVKQAYDRLKYADLDEAEAGQVVLAYMTDDKDLRIPVESLFRSLSLVLLDNASAEFTFIVRFFARSMQPVPSRSQADTPTSAPTPLSGGASDATSDVEALRGGTPTPKRRGTIVVDSSDESLKDAQRIFHEVFDPALEYCTQFFQSVITPSPPPAIPLLSLIRLNDQIISTADTRGCLPLLPFLQAQKLAMWPIYRKEMDGHVDSLKKLADDAEGKGLAGFVGKGVKDGSVRVVASRYAALFSCVTALSEEAEEAMIFSR